MLWLPSRALSSKGLRRITINACILRLRAILWIAHPTALNLLVALYTAWLRPVLKDSAAVFNSVCCFWKFDGEQDNYIIEDQKLIVACYSSHVYSELKVTMLCLHHATGWMHGTQDPCTYVQCHVQIHNKKCIHSAILLWMHVCKYKLQYKFLVTMKDVSQPIKIGLFCLNSIGQSLHFKNVCTLL